MQEKRDSVMRRIDELVADLKVLNQEFAKMQEHIAALRKLG